MVISQENFLVPLLLLLLLQSQEVGLPRHPYLCEYLLSLLLLPRHPRLCEYLLSLLFPCLCYLSHRVSPESLLPIPILSHGLHVHLPGLTESSISSPTACGLNTRPCHPRPKSQTTEEWEVHRGRKRQPARLSTRTFLFWTITASSAGVFPSHAAPSSQPSPHTPGTLSAHSPYMASVCPPGLLCKRQTRDRKLA